MGMLLTCGFEVVIEWDCDFLLMRFAKSGFDTVVSGS